MNIPEIAAPARSANVTPTSGSFEEAAAFNRRGLLVGGCPKSGTTLLLSLLDSHPQLVVFPKETHYLDERRKYARFKGFAAKLRHLVERSDIHLLEQVWRESGNNAAFDYKHFAQLAENFVSQPRMNDSLLLTETIRAFAVSMDYDWRECVRWVEKTPSNVPCADDLFRLFPGAKLLHIVRDPRAVFASRQRLLMDRCGSHAKAHRLVREWNESSRQITRLRDHAANYLVIRYEDLVRRSYEVLGEVCQFIGIDFFPSMLEPTRAGKRWRGNSAFNRAFNGIDAKPLDHWKTELTADEIWWIELHCHQGMNLAGYPLETDARFSLRRWAKRLPGESWKGYLRARKSSALQLAGALEDCRYVASADHCVPATARPEAIGLNCFK